MRRGSAPRLAVIAVVLTAAFAAGLSAAALWAAPSDPASLATPSAAAEVPVIVREFRDTRSVSLRITTAADVTLEAGSPGRVTASSCIPGGSLASGDSLVSLDDRPIVALATSTPLWRDLRAGDEGPDVEALQTELARLGASVAVDGRAGRVTMRAVARLFALAGDDSLDGTTMPVGRIIWLPAVTVAPASCAAAVGSTVAAGTALATIAGGIASASVVSMPSDLAVGERSVTVDEAVLPVEADGAIRAPEALAALAATPSYERSAQVVAAGAADATGDSDGGRPPLAGELSLREPVEVGVVPPTSVYSLVGATACVASGGRAFAVTVVGSQLGRTFVRFDEGSTPTSVDIRTGKRPSCG
jgi:peptidoglycan hydrolase-like protein with peptidoglycan-binding domain